MHMLLQVSLTIENHATSFLSKKEVSYFYEQKCIKKNTVLVFFVLLLLVTKPVFSLSFEVTYICL